MQRITPFVTSLHWRRVSSAHSRSEALACVALALALSACDRNSSEVVTEVDPRIPSADAASTAAAVGRQRVFILPWEGVVGRCLFRLGVEANLAPDWPEELATLYRAIDGLRYPRASPEVADSKVA